MQYYIEISSWNLLESFVTESISPFAFYEERNFGNNLSRFLSSEKEKSYFLILSTKDLGGDFSICVDESLIDKDALNPINGLKTAFTYSKTIYYKKGAVRFRFSSEELKNSIISESHILLEVKCLEKYLADFYIEKKVTKNVKRISYLENAISFDKESYIDYDNKINKIKGAIVGYAIGLYTTSGESNQKLQNDLRDLKNSFGGFNTEIMMSEIFNENKDLLSRVDECKSLYFNLIESTNSFDVLKAQYSEITKLAKMRAADFKMNNSSSKEKQKENLLKNKTDIENQISNIEKKYNINSVKRELKKIKDAEKENGRKIGKTRQFFKKDTIEYNRKQELNAIIQEFEDSNEEYKKLKIKLLIIEQQLVDNPGKYDATLSSIFMRISDILNDLIKNASVVTNKGNIDFSKIETKQGLLTIKNPQNDAEICYLNILLDCIFEENEMQQLSEFYILQLLEKSAQKYKKNILSENEMGQKILNCLRVFWKYKNQKVEQFDIPDNMPILQSIMSFFVKPLGFDQIERYMMIKKFTHKAYAFMLWGSCVGFADMPKTFTNVLYQNEELSNKIDDFMFNIII